MTLLDWAGLIVGAGLIASGVYAIWKRRANVPEAYEGSKAVILGWVWITIGTTFVAAVVFDIDILKTFFRLFLEAAN